MRTEIAAARTLLERATSIAIITHVRPDGDAIASLLALNLSLNETGKHATAVLRDEVPLRFKGLPGAEFIQDTFEQNSDLLIAVDCADLSRMSLPADKKQLTVHINIDHHPTNPKFGNVNIVDPIAASTTQVLYELMPELGLPITLEVATNLLAGLVTDTIGFRTDNVTPRVLRMAADLVEVKAPLATIYEKGLTQQTYASVKYWGCGLFRLERDDKIIWTSLHLEDRTKVGYQGNDDADLTNLLSSVEGVDVAIIFIEQPGGSVKVSFRSRENVNVADLAAKFGGGGHAPAAGAMIEGGLDQIMESVLSATRALVNSESEHAK